ncbi:MAG: glycerophosphodiester phosphodiesterase [Acidimicrobiales bacterium]
MPKGKSTGDQARRQGHRGFDPSHDPVAAALVTAVVAHRGAHQRVRENTRRAFEAALALGVDGIEFDVRPTSDGALVIHHDPLVEGRPLSLTPAGELPDWVPSLGEVLELTRGVVAHVELKNAREAGEVVYDETGALVRATLAELEGARLERRPVVSCFDLATCARVRARGADVAVAWLVEGGPLEGALTEAHVLELDGLNPHFTDVDGPAVALAHELGLALNVWTVNAEADLVALVALGVDGVITDEPARAQALLGRGGTGR